MIDSRVVIIIIACDSPKAIMIQTIFDNFQNNYGFNSL